MSGWWSARGRRDRTEAAAAAELVCECTAFVSGRLAIERIKRDGFARDWEWLNLLAHGNDDQLIELALGRPPVRPGSPYEEKWYEALGYLAKQILDIVASGRESLASLQRSVLIPLELELAGQESQRTTPQEAVGTVLKRLQLLVRHDNVASRRQGLQEPKPESKCQYTPSEGDGDANSR